MPQAGQKQHVDLFRKLMLRRRLLRDALPGPAYVPFCGDGDIAKELYADRPVYAADLDADRVYNAQASMPSAVVRQADCDDWPFPDLDLPPFTLCDFDAYADPYASFRSFWQNAEKAPTVCLLFTDAQRGNIFLNGRFTHPDGSKVQIDTDIRNEKRRIYNFYFRKTVLPWFNAYIAPYQAKKTPFYHRNYNMLYWGAVVEL